MHLQAAVRISIAFLSVANADLTILERADLEPTSCPGVLHHDGNNNDAFCYVGGELTLSNCLGWPICTGPTSFDPATTTLSCATDIPLTASDYSKLILSASDSFYNSKGEPAKTEATPTASGDSPKTTGDSDSTPSAADSPMTTAAGGDTTASAADASQTTGAPSTTTPNAAPRTGVNMLAVGLAVAVLGL